MVNGMVNGNQQRTNEIRPTRTSRVDSDDADATHVQHLLAAYEDDDLEQLEQGDDAAGQAALLGVSVTNKPKDLSLFQRLMLPLDERLNVKMLMRTWRPRLEFVVRLMLVTTFLDDSFRTALTFTEHTNQVGEQGCLKWLVATSPGLVAIIATVALGIGLLAQTIGSFCLLALIQPDAATKALIGWTMVQPVLYAQLSNFEFVAESLSLVGGLLMLRAHLVSEQRTQLLGRLLLPLTYLYYAGLFIFSAFTLDETNSLVMYVSSLSMFVINTAVIVALIIGTMLVAAGLKSRLVALILALLNLGFVCHQHPFFFYIWREGGEWKYDENMPIPHVALPTDVLPSDLDMWQIYDLHRYYFFLGLSTSGALLLLAQFGPGEIAVQKNEVLLPVVARAQD